MSIWADINRRSQGYKPKTEDFAIIYGKRDEPEVIFSEDYKEGNYAIITNGMYPRIRIILKMRLSIFTGDTIVRLKTEDGKIFSLDRHYSNGQTFFFYVFSKDGDFVGEGDPEMSLDKPHPGHKYTLEELKDYAKMFIDMILEQHYDFDNYMK